jgi:predicted permease
LRAQNLQLSVGFAVARLVLSFGIAVGVSELLGLSGIAQGALVLQGVMPAAVFNYLFAARYERAVEDVAGIVLASTLLTGALLPFIVSYVLWLSG